MPLTTEEFDHLRELIDGLNTAHVATLEVVERLRGELEALRPLATVVELYINARSGANDLDPANVRTLMMNRLLDYTQRYGVMA